MTGQWWEVTEGEEISQTVGSTRSGQRERVWGRRRRTVAKYHQKRDMGLVWCSGQGSKGKGEMKFGEKVPSQQRSGAGSQDKERMCKGHESGSVTFGWWRRPSTATMEICE
jgi:hypothetical protein